MQQAVNLANGNRRAPFAAILIHRNTGEVVAEGLNQSKSSPILHGEMDAIQRYARSGETGWTELRLYTTAEPCCMCMGAILWARIPEVIYGTSIPRLIELGWDQVHLRAEQVALAADFTSCRIEGGVLAEECDGLFRNARSHT